MFRVGRVCCVVLLVAAVGAASASVELIELNDPNQAKLGSVLSKAVRGLQSALQGGFQLASSQQVDKFLAHCDLLADEMDRSSDDAYGGLAKQLKAILASSQVASACQVDRAHLDQFRPLDTDFKPAECDYLATGKFQKLVDMKRQLEASEGLSLLFGHLFRSTVQALGARLLQEAAHDFEILLGEQEQQKGWFDLEIRYKRACSLAQLRPICRLARRTSHEGAGAVGADLADFGKLVQSDDQQAIAEYEQKSGVQMETLRDNCARLREQKSFKPMSQLEAYQEAKFISGEQVAAQRRASSELDLYYELYQLCKLV